MTDLRKNIEGIKMKCKRCVYSWKTKSKAIYVSCPMCMTKNKIEVNWNKMILKQIEEDKEREG